MTRRPCHFDTSGGEIFRRITINRMVKGTKTKPQSLDFPLPLLPNVTYQILCNSPLLQCYINFDTHDHVISNPSGRFDIQIRNLPQSHNKQHLVRQQQYPQSQSLTYIRQPCFHKAFPSYANQSPTPKPPPITLKTFEIQH